MTIVPVFALSDLWWMSPAGEAAIVIVGAAALYRCRSQLAGTTLLAPWRWAMFSFVALVSAELALMLPSLASSDWIVYLRYAAGITTFATQMAVMGSKRPQDRSWQFVVLSLLAVLLLPAANSLLRSPVPWTIDSPWRWFLLVLLLVGLANYVATRYWPSSLLFAIGQSIVLGEHLPWPVSNLAGASKVTGLVALVAAGLLVAFQFPRRRRRTDPVDRLWIDFRDLFGSMWSLRIAQRFNASAVMYQWPAHITWRGLSARSPRAATADHVEPADDGPSNDAATHEAMCRNLRTLLRRFVSPEWIAGRLSGS